MRSSNTIYRRGHANRPAGRGEEKKEDSGEHHCHNHSSDYHHTRATLPLADAPEEKDRRYSTFPQVLVRLGYKISSPLFLVEYRKEIVLGALFLFVVFHYGSNVARSIATYLAGPRRQHLVLEGIKVAFPFTGSRDVAMPGAFVSTQADFFVEDYGRLQFDLLEEDGMARLIKYTGNEKLWEEFVPPRDENLDRYYYAYDDEVRRNPYRGWGKDNKGHLEKTHHCRQTAFHREQTPTCNEIHQIDFNWYASQDRGYYLGGGSFRDVFLLEKENRDPLAVLKTASYTTKYAAHNFEYYRMDSAVQSALAPHPLVVDIYSSCSLALVAEAMSEGDVNVVSIPKYSRHHCKRTDLLEDENELVKMNDLEATTKLEWALQMAESVALLHNHWRGVIVHDDVQPFQWLITEAGNIKMNDFNRAEFMLYDEEHGEYCKYKNGIGPGDFRAPEEYMNKPLDEKIDIFSLGNNFYGLLTGVYPIYTNCHDDQIGGYIKKGEKPYIDPLWSKESFAEAELVNIIYECWHWHPENRPSIGELVLMLRESVDKNRDLIAKGLTELEESQGEAR